jgi:hypothetical protein
MRVLFIGNSHTFANGLPYQVREMINFASGREECQAWMCAAGGQTLAWHAREPGTLVNLACHRWDFVVLQQQTHPFAGHEQLAADFAGLEPHIRRSGAEPLLFVTWKHKDAPEREQDELDAAFGRLSSETGSRLVPVGAAWRLARREHPEIELYAPDGAHAAPAGTYLAACLFFRALTGKSPSGLPARLAANGTVLADLVAEQAVNLHSIAADL